MYAVIPRLPIGANCFQIKMWLSGYPTRRPAANTALSSKCDDLKASVLAIQTEEKHHVHVHKGHVSNMEAI
jgi:hypothetical protein